MKYTTLLLLFGLLAITMPTWAQGSWQASAGIGWYATYGDYERDEFAENGQIFGRGSGNVADDLTGFSLRLGYRYDLGSRWRAGLSVQGQYGAGQSPTNRIYRRTTPAGTIELDLTSDRWLAAAWADLTLSYNLLSPQLASKLYLGTGLAAGVRQQNYRNYLYIDFDEFNQVREWREEFVDVSERALGVPVVLQYESAPLAGGWRLTATAAGHFFRNEDRNLGFSLGVARAW